MIQQETMVSIADNSGAKTAQCIRVLGKSGASGKFTRATGNVGDIICVAIKKWLPTCQLDNKKVHKCVIVRTNAAVMIDEEGNPIGTRIFGAVARELREKNYMKIVSLASEVV
jgi:large subunit ribosomal protein L14